MNKYVELNKDKYFMDLINDGVQVPYNFDVDKISRDKILLFKRK